MEVRCRICSRTEPFASVPLSSRPEASQETIFDMLAYCTQLEVSPDDSLPQRICSDCLRNLTGAFEFKRLCHQSDASFRQMLRQESRDGEPPPTPTKTDSDTCPTLVDGTSTKGPQRTITYQCCFKRCDRKTTDYVKLREHAKKNHQTRRRGNALRRRQDHHFVCAICMGGFSSRLEWNIHRALLRGVQRVYQCFRCSESFRTEEKLATHMVAGGCGQQEKKDEDKDEATDAQLVSLQQHLIRQILKAKATNGLVRINEKEYDTVLKNKAAFLGSWHRNELKNTSKRVKLFYVCEACNFRTEIRDEVVRHLEIGTCTQGFYMALGFRAVKLHYVQSLECKTCGYRTESTGNLKRHQLIHNHSGIRRNKITKQVAEREYPCEYCVRVFTTCNNRKRHRKTCAQVAGITISKEPLSIEDVTLCDQLRASKDNASKEECEEQQELLLTELKIEEYDPLEAMNQSAHEQEQTPEPPTKKVKRSSIGKTVPTCEICGYTTDKRGNFNRHLKTCRKKLPLKLSTVRHETFSTEGTLATRKASERCRQQKEDEKPIDNSLALPWQDLIRRILKAKATNGLVRLDEKEYDTVLENNASFLKRLHRVEWKHSSKQVKLFYVCEACNFRTEIRDEVLTHLDSGTCVEGFYMALGFRVVNVRCVQIFECKKCDFRTENTGNLRKHQRRRNHFEIRTIKTTKQVAEREYPCEYCGRVFTTSSNRKRHRSTCSRVPRSTISNVPIGPLTTTFEDTTSKEECEEHQESLLTELKVEEYDLQEAISQRTNDQQRVAEPPTKKVKGRRKRSPNGKTTALICKICGYTTDKRGNLNRHLKTCLLKVPPIQSTYFGSTDSE
ncbi:zinc finger protein 236-like [Ochlerotatus camptorhynchus]|uniref:zinc finger protein 236-like n=1 Tax=Ochlerotatus camptorhynchus TaxID=644619 RepID=UPI0031D650B4